MLRCYNINNAPLIIILTSSSGAPPCGRRSSAPRPWNPPSRASSPARRERRHARQPGSIVSAHARTHELAASRRRVSHPPRRAAVPRPLRELPAGTRNRAHDMPRGGPQDIRCRRWHLQRTRRQLGHRAWAGTACARLRAPCVRYLDVDHRLVHAHQRAQVALDGGLRALPAGRMAQARRACKPGERHSRLPGWATPGARRTPSAGRQRGARCRALCGDSLGFCAMMVASRLPIW